MRKYIYYCNVESMSPHKTEDYLKHVAKGMKSTGFFGPVDKLMLIAIKDGQSRLEVFKPAFIENIMAYIDYYFGTLDKSM